MKKLKSHEHETQKAILEWLAYQKPKGIMSWRNNTGAYKTEFGGYVRYGCPGSPDIFVLLPPHGQFCGIEVKAPGKYLSPVQKAFEASVKAAGGRYILARDVLDVINEFKEFEF